jgi:hypothetical protein
MTDRPILFSGAMVRAILDGRKTQTRRVVMTRHPITHLGGSDEEDDPATWGWAFDGPDYHGYAVLGRGLNEDHNNGRTSIPCPYGEPGDRLWVRETWRRSTTSDRYHYLADIHDDRGLLEETRGQWKPSIYMRREASRITIAVTSVRVERVRDITEEDARAEGVSPGEQRTLTSVGAFAVLWDLINGKRPGCSWADDPFVWVVGFEVAR